MNRDTIEGSWEQFKGRVKTRWGKFTGSHFEMIDGKCVELSGEIQQGYGATREVADQQIENLENRTRPQGVAQERSPLIR